MSTPISSKNTFTFAKLQCTRGERRLFSGLDASITSGQCLHVVGANGSGKTSLLRILCGISAADSGTLQWNNSPLNEQHFGRSHYIGHKDALKNELSAIENLRFYQQIDSPEKTYATGQKADDVLDDCLNKMQILDCADLTAQQLSFGQRRRLAFAKLLLRPADLWILDEPFTGVDKDGRELINDICVDHLERGGMIILTHHLSLANSVLAQYTHELTIAKFSSNTLDEDRV